MAKFEKNIYLDCTETDQPEGTYRFAKNIVDSNLLGTKENEDGFTDLNVATPYTFIGSISIDNNSAVVFSTDNTNSEIGIVNLTTGSYTTIYNDPNLDFSTSNPIKGEYRKDVNGQRVVSWTDNLNTPRILNIDNLSGINDIQDLNVFQDVNNPEISTSSVNDFGGSFKTSAVIPITKYKNQDGSETNWFVHDHVFYINDDSKGLPFNDNDGAAPGSPSNKSVSFTLTGCDIRYDTIVVGYIQVINNITTAYKAFERSNSSTLSLTITGSETTEDVSLDELLTPTANYKTAKAITQLNGQLYLANLTADPIPELQQYALGIKIDYTRETTTVVSNTNSHKDNLPPVFMPGEVYAFYLGVELLNGGWGFYHIPGRPAVGTVGVSNDTDVINDSNLGITYNRYQVQNTTDRASLGATTNMGYWENTNEVYPNHSSFDGTAVGNPDLRNQKVRHHRFPTLSKLNTSFYPLDAAVGVTQLIRLGISVSNVNIPPAIQSKIKRWKIFFAKKTNTNSVVIGSDLYQPGVGTESNPSLRWSAGGNWKLFAESGGSDSWEDFITPTYDTLRGHCLDFLINPSDAQPAYVEVAYRLRRRGLNLQYLGFRGIGCRLTISGEGSGQCASAVIDFTVPAVTDKFSYDINLLNLRKRVDNFTYLPQNALSGNFKTEYTEGVFVANLYNAATDFGSVLTPIALNTNSSGQSSDPEQFRTITGATDPDVGEDVFYLYYCKILSNVHTSFTQQDLIPVEGYATPSQTSKNFYGGDTFMCYMSFLTAAPSNANPNGTVGDPFGQGVRMWKAYIGYSKYNLNYRYQTQGEIGTYYHGKTDVRTLFTPIVGNSPLGPQTLVRTEQALNLVNYDTTMNTSNVFSVGVIYNPDIIPATQFPNTVIWSNVQSEESSEFSWRSFPTGNRYTITKNKGDIVNIQGLKNKELVLQTTYSFFRTRTDAKVQAEAENIFFKSASLFDLPPEELVPTTSGYAGTQNKFACVLTKAGFIYPDDLQGKIFLYNGDSLEEISSNGTRIFFRDFMGLKQNNEDNPFTGNGYTIGYDEQLNRIIVTKKHASLHWTISYNPTKKAWTSWHDYIPSYLFNTLGGELYSVSENGFYLNRGGAKGVYYTTTPASSYIDAPFASDTKNKEDIAISWVTEVYPNTYIDGQPNSTLDYNSTFTHLTLRSKDHCTGRIALSRFDSIDSYNTSNTRVLDRTWYFNDIRDIAIEQGFTLGFYNNFNIDPTKLNTNMEWYEQRRFIDKYVICRFEYDNTQNKRILFLDANIATEYVQR